MSLRRNSAGCCAEGGDCSQRHGHNTEKDRRIAFQRAIVCFRVVFYFLFFFVRWRRAAEESSGRWSRGSRNHRRQRDTKIFSSRAASPEERSSSSEVPGMDARLHGRARSPSRSNAASECASISIEMIAHIEFRIVRARGR